MLEAILKTGLEAILKTFSNGHATPGHSGVRCFDAARLRPLRITRYRRPTSRQEAPALTEQQDIFARAIAPEGSSSVVPLALFLFAHPDDEVIGLGARLGRFPSAHFVHTTDGVPPDGVDSRAHGFATLAAYREARRAEFTDALQLADIASAGHESLEMPDQQTALRLGELTRRVEELFVHLRPAVVFTHSYEGGHPDHDACAFAVQHAVAALGRTAPLIIEAAGYHADPDDPSAGFVTNAFLHTAQAIPTQIYALTSAEQERKAELLAAFRSQANTLQYFNTDTEAFRVAPAYDFTRPPHPGPVWYDRYGWPISSSLFCELAADALDALYTRQIRA